MNEIATPFGVSDAPLPEDSVIELLETLLAEARRGEILGIVFGAVRPNRCVMFGVKSGRADCNLLVAAATHAPFDLLRAIEQRA